MKVTDKMIDDLAHLARLEFKAEDKEAIRTDLEKIIGFCEKLNEVDTEGVEPLIFMTDEVNIMGQAGADKTLRDDEVKNQLTRDEALLNAPKKDSDYFRVPKVIEK